MASPAPSRRRPARVALAALAVAVLAAGAGVGAYELGVFQQAAREPAGDRAPSPSVSPLRLPAARPEQPVLASPGGAPKPTRAGLRRDVAEVLAAPALGTHVGVGVVDLTHGRRVLGLDARGSFVPASLVKLFTVAAALEALGPEHRFETSVVAIRGTRRIVLVGGGDPLLTKRRPARESTTAGSSAPASLADLAARTAQALQQRNTRRVRLELDAGLFTGPSVNPTWPIAYLEYGIAQPVAALAVDDTRPDGPGPSEIPDPVEAAGAAFARLLEQHGVEVTTVGERPAPERAVELATVRSLPLSDVVDEVLVLSDNEAAEVLLRHVALARGAPASFTGGVRAVLAELAGLGVTLRGVRLLDGSGLSYGNAVTVDAVLDLLETAARAQRPDLRPLLTELPVARFTGSLADRFGAPSAAAGRGLVRAKTGTLSGVHALAGVLVSRDGTLLGFAALADQVRPGAVEPAQRALDRLAAALAGCGCR